MIQKQTVVLWKDSDGGEHRSLDAVRIHEIAKLFEGFGDFIVRSNMANRVLLESDKIMDLLTTTESSIPKARAVNGGKKPRKTKRVEALQTTISGTGLPPEILDEARKEEAK